MHSTYNYFIDLDDITIIKQKCKRLLLDLANSERDMDYLINNNIKNGFTAIDRRNILNYFIAFNN
jgi:hypothetical protein